MPILPHESTAYYAPRLMHAPIPEVTPSLGNNLFVFALPD